MRKTTAFAAMILVSILVVACGTAEAPPAEEAPEFSMTDLGGREINIFIENAYPPFNYLDDNGEGIGWDYDVARELCDRLNCTPVFVEGAWEGWIEAMAGGEYDMGMDGITLNLPRSLSVDFSDPYVEYGQVILVRADEDRPDFADQDSLVASDVTIGTQIGTTNEEVALSLFGEDRIVSFEQYDLPVVALLAGDVDSVIIDEVAAIGFMGENPGEMKIAMSVTSGELLAFPFPPQSELIAPINWAMQEMFADGTMDEICEEWLLRPCSPE
jgi:polar amino acid transport system substrate-binding protein